ncbi:MAG TPA: hypothetical protein EYQ83_17980 [Acidobacteria bacterium]|nr:hypothetical protein [Acidobacteriota bacterium]
MTKDRHWLGPESVLISTKRETQRSRRVHPDEEQALITACDQLDDAKHWYAGRELNPRIEAALDLGLRRGEMLTLHNSDIDWVKHRAVLRGATTKSAILRAIPFDAEGEWRHSWRLVGFWDRIATRLADGRQPGRLVPYSLGDAGAARTRRGSHTGQAPGESKHGWPRCD